MVALKYEDTQEVRPANVLRIADGHMTPELANVHNRALLAEYELHLERQHTQRVYRTLLAELLKQHEDVTTGTEPLEYEHHALQMLVLGEG